MCNLTPLIPLSFDKERGKRFLKGAAPLFDSPFVVYRG